MPYEFIVSGVISGFLGAFVLLLGFIWVLKSSILRAMFIDLYGNLMYSVKNDVEVQKSLYMVGGYIGNGIKAGVGLPKMGGKMKLEDLAINLIGNYLLPKQSQTSNIEEQTEFPKKWI